jgi:hypothetical protein
MTRALGLTPLPGHAGKKDALVLLSVNGDWLSIAPKAAKIEPGITQEFRAWPATTIIT